MSITFKNNDCNECNVDMKIMKNLYLIIFLISVFSSNQVFGQQFVKFGIDIDGEAAGDEFGRSVSLSDDGTIMAIGAFNNDGSGSNSGHVRIYQYSNNSWSQMGPDIDGEAADDRSGYAVSLSSDGTRVAIGAIGNNGSSANVGHVRVYQYSNNTWSQLGSDIDGEAAGDRSGWSVSLSSDGTKLAIGAPYNDGSGSNAGHVRVYQYSNNFWSQVGSDIDGEASDDYSGWSVSLSDDGTILAVGAYLNNGSGTGAGHVRVFQYSNNIWNQLGTDIDGEAAGDRSGWSVSLSSDGTKLAIGAPYNDGSGSDAGHVRVYQYSNNLWSQLGTDIDGEASGDNAGRSVSLTTDGSKLAIGAIFNDGSSSDAGHVRVYQYSNNFWSQVGSDIDGEASDDHSGGSVSLSSDGNIMAIGAYYNDGSGLNAGHVRVYRPVIQLGLDIDGEAVNDNSGWSVSLSDDGTIMAIGAPYNDGSGSNVGHVRVYQYTNNIWSQLGSDIDGEAPNDQSGYSVSLSSDGTKVAVGANLNDGSGTNAGHVRVYQYSNNTWSQLGSDIDGEAPNDQSGYSVSLSSDGTKVAVGAYLNDGSGTNSGHVRVYKCTNNIWSQLGSDIDGEAANIQSGYSVSLSADGYKLAIGAPYNGSNSGRVRVYQYSNSSWSQLGTDIDGEVGPDYSGWSISLSSIGMKVAIGAPYNDGAGSNSGHVRTYVLIPEYSWNGSAWSPSTPTSTDNVLFNGNYTVSAGSSFTANDLMVSSGNTLTLEASSSGYAQLKVNGSLVNEGTVIAKQYMTGTGHHAVSSPMSNGFTTTNGTSAALYAYNASTGAYNMAPTLTSAGTGFFAPLGTSGFLTSAGTFSATGTPTTSHTHTLGYAQTQVSGGSGSGWNLIGNPYTCGLDWSTVTKTNVNNAYYVWDPTSSTYQYYSPTALTGTYLAASSILSGVIAPMQAFWVQASSSSAASIVSTMAAAGTVSTSPTFYKTAPDNLILYVEDLSDPSLSDAMWITHATGYTNDFEGDQDAWKLNNYGAKASIFSYHNGDKLAINAIDLSSTASVPVGVMAPEVGKKYHLVLEQVVNNQDYRVILEDRLFNSFTDITGQGYGFTYGAWQNEDPRFVVHINQSTVGMGESSASTVKAYQQVERLILQGNGQQHVSYAVSALDGRVIAQGLLQAGMASIVAPQVGVYIVNFIGAAPEAQRVVIQ